MSHEFEDKPELAVVIVAPSGKIYKVEASEWSDEGNLVQSPQAQGMVNELTQLGTYLASVPNDFAAGAGIECIVVNVKSIVGE